MTPKAARAPLLGAMVPIDRIRLRLEMAMIDNSTYAGVFDCQEKGPIASVGNSADCPEAIRAEREGVVHAVGCTDRLGGWLDEVLTDKITKIESVMMCEDKLHYCFKIVSSSNHAVGVLFVGPVLYPGQEESAEEMRNAATPRAISKEDDELLRSQCMKFTKTISAEYCQAANRNTVWVAMPFADEFNDTYKFGIAEALRELGYIPKRIDRTGSHKEILNGIREGMANCAFVIADDSGANANVLWELGRADVLPRMIVLLSRGRSRIPFSTSQIQHIKYRPDRLSELQESITSWVRNWQEKGLLPIGKTGDIPDQEIMV